MQAGAQAKTKVNTECRMCHPVSKMTLQILLRRSMLESMRRQSFQQKPLITLCFHAIMASPQIIFWGHDES